MTLIFLRNRASVRVHTHRKHGHVKGAERVGGQPRSIGRRKKSSYSGDPLGAPSVPGDQVQAVPLLEEEAQAEQQQRPGSRVEPG